MLERYDIEDEAFVLDMHNYDAMNTQDGFISQRPHKD